MMQSLILVAINEVMSMQQMAQALGRVVGPMILSALRGSQFGLKWPSGFFFARCKGRIMQFVCWWMLVDKILRPVGWLKHSVRVFAIPTGYRILSNSISPERHAVVDRLSNQPLMSRFSIDPRYPYACAAAAAMIGGLVLMSLGHSFRSRDSNQCCIMSGEHGASAALFRLCLHVCGPIRIAQFYSIWWIVLEFWGLMLLDIHCFLWGKRVIAAWLHIKLRAGWCQMACHHS